MREKLNTLPLSELKELAKAQGLKGFSSLRKAELIDLLCQSAEKEEQTSGQGAEPSKQKVKLSGQEMADTVQETVKTAKESVKADQKASNNMKESSSGGQDAEDRGVKAEQIQEAEQIQKAKQVQEEQAQEMDMEDSVKKQNVIEEQKQSPSAEQGSIEEQNSEPELKSADPNLSVHETTERPAEQSTEQLTEQPMGQSAEFIRQPAGQSTGQKSAESRHTKQKIMDQKSDKQRMEAHQMETQQTEIRKEAGRDNFRNDRNDRSSDRSNDRSDRNDRNIERNEGNRTNRSRVDGKGSRVVTRFENRTGYQNRGRSQENGRGQDNTRNQDGGRMQDNGRNQDARNQDARNQDNSRFQENIKVQENNKNQENSRFQENGRSQEGSRFQENSRYQDSSSGQDTGRSQESGRNQELVQNQENGRTQEYTRSQDIRPVDINQEEILDLDSGMEANGILEVMPDGFGFIRCENFLPGDNDVYVAPSQIRRFNMKTGDIIRGNRRVKSATEKFAALLYVTSINGYPVGVAEKRPNFEDLTPIFPNERIHMETSGKSTMAMRVLDLMAPIGKGQRGMIVSPPKAGKTTLLKQVAKAITANQPNMHLIILLIDERPEEVTDIKEAIVGNNVEVIYSTFDELPERHKRVSEMVIERARRLVEHGRDVTILLDSITRLARAYNLVVPPSGRTLSGGLDPSALHMPKRFFGAARNMREGGSLTILATALIDTGSRMDDVIYEEFKGTGNMELVLDRKLSERRIFPAIDILKSGTRRDDLLLSREEAEAMEIIRRATNAMKPEESVEKLMDLFTKTRNNQELVAEIRRRRYV